MHAPGERRAQGQQGDHAGNRAKLRIQPGRRHQQRVSKHGSGRQRPIGGEENPACRIRPADQRIVVEVRAELDIEPEYPQPPGETPQHHVREEAGGARMRLDNGGFMT